MSNNKILKPFQKRQQLQNLDDNRKKILCHNIIFNKQCHYYNTCVYAHNLSEQNVEQKKKIAYNILKSKKSLSNVNLKTNTELYKTLIELTKLCNKCDTNLCIGGYNCKYGACLKKFVVCANDLNYGQCTNQNCKFIHLTNRGLIPYYEHIEEDDNKSLNISNMSFSSNDVEENVINEVDFYTNKKNRIETICAKSIFA